MASCRFACRYSLELAVISAAFLRAWAFPSLSSRTVISVSSASIFSEYVLPFGITFSIARVISLSANSLAFSSFSLTGGFPYRTYRAELMSA